MLTALYCVTISRESMHKHDLCQTLKLQSAVVTVNIRSSSLKFTLFCLQTKYMYFRQVENFFGSEERAQKRLN